MLYRIKCNSVPDETAVNAGIHFKKYYATTHIITDMTTLMNRIMMYYEQLLNKYASSPTDITLHSQYYTDESHLGTTVFHGNFFQSKFRGNPTKYAVFVAGNCN